MRFHGGEVNRRPPTNEKKKELETSGESKVMIGWWTLASSCLISSWHLEAQRREPKTDAKKRHQEEGYNQPIVSAYVLAGCYLHDTRD